MMIFDRQIDGQRVYDALQSMRHSPLLGLDSTIIVTRDSNGVTSLYQRRQVLDLPQAKEVDVLSQIADLLFSPDSEEPKAVLAKEGLDEQFVERINQAMDVDRSALLTLLSYEDISDRDELLRTLALFKGQIFQTTISAEFGFRNHIE